MSQSFAITAESINDRFMDEASKGDIRPYEFDFSAWLDGAAITAATWTLSAGSAVISSPVIDGSKVRANIAFNAVGRSSISIIVSAGNMRKRLTLLVKATDPQYIYDDYGLCND